MAEHNESNLQISVEEQVEAQTELTPAELEKELLEQKLAEATAKHNPEDVAAQLWTLYWPIYKNVVNRLSNKQLKRLLTNIIEVGLEDKKYHLVDKDEKQVYSIAMNLLNAKWQMMLHTLSQHYQKNPQDLAEEVKKDLPTKQEENLVNGQ
jgi:HD superfamily phosphohydrolase